MMRHSGILGKQICRQFICYIFPILKQTIDTAGQLLITMVADKVLKVARIDPHQTIELYRAKIAVGDGAAHRPL
jgi:hypothetical protein